MTPEDIQPNSAAPAPTPEVTPKAGAPDQEAGLPDELLQIPAMQALFSGSPPAFSTDIKTFGKRPEAKIIGKDRNALQNAGIGLYRSLAGDMGVLFNQLHISGADLQQADKAGRLAEVAPPFDTVNAHIASSGENNPVLNASVPQGPKIPAIAPPPASVQNKAATARLKALTPQGPTSGAAPGAGRVLNSILKPVV